MSQSDWEARATPDEAGSGITRRDALRRGTLAGLGLVWVTPQMASFTMTAQFAQATSPVPETTVPENGTTTQPETGGSSIETTPSSESTEPSTETTEEVEGITVETTQPSAGGTQVEARDEIKDEVLSDQLPFTGLPVEQLLPLAGGAIATGAAVVRLAREKKEKEVEGTE